jgi:hypothetical protein
MAGTGTGNTMTDCVAVGGAGIKTGSGYQWPSKANHSHSTWGFSDCLAHNNNALGIYAWQNDGSSHPIVRFTAYHNGRGGVLHGSYKNRYEYDAAVLFGNGGPPLQLHATSPLDPYHIEFRDCLFDCAGLADHAVTTSVHALPAESPTVFERCTMRGFRRSAIGLIREGTTPDIIDLTDCDYLGNAFWLEDGIHADSLVRNRGGSLGDFDLRRADQPGGVFVPEWNARRYDI